MDTHLICDINHDYLKIEQMQLTDIQSQPNLVAVSCTLLRRRSFTNFKHTHQNCIPPTATTAHNWLSRSARGPRTRESKWQLHGRLQEGEAERNAKDKSTQGMGYVEVLLYNVTAVNEIIKKSMIILQKCRKSFLSA